MEPPGHTPRATRAGAALSAVARRATPPLGGEILCGGGTHCGGLTERTLGRPWGGSIVPPSQIKSKSWSRGGVLFLCFILIFKWLRWPKQFLASGRRFRLIICKASSCFMYTMYLLISGLAHGFLHNCFSRCCMYHLLMFCSVVIVQLPSNSWQHVRKEKEDIHLHTFDQQATSARNAGSTRRNGMEGKEGGKGTVGPTVPTVSTVCGRMVAAAPRPDHRNPCLRHAEGR